jgi:hypothetical protein
MLIPVKRSAMAETEKHYGNELFNHNYITICFKQISFNTARKFVTNFCYTSVYKQKHVDMLLIGQ